MNIVWTITFWLWLGAMVALIACFGIAHIKGDK